MELIIRPSVLFLDEPTTGLDANTAFTVMNQLALYVWLNVLIWFDLISLIWIDFIWFTLLIKLICLIWLIWYQIYIRFDHSKGLVTMTLTNVVRTIFWPLRKWKKIVRTTFVRVIVTKPLACKNDSRIFRFCWKALSYACHFLHFHSLNQALRRAMGTATARVPVQICDINPEQPTDLFCKKNHISIFCKRDQWVVRDWNHIFEHKLW